MIRINSSYMPDFKADYIGFDYSVGGGININQRWTVLVNFNYLKCQRDNKSDNFPALQILTTSLSSSFRILSPKFRFSPIIELDAGVDIWSNAYELYISNGYVVGYESDYKSYQFNKYSFFGKTKLLLNIDLKPIDINIGPSFNTYFFRKTAPTAFSTPYHYLEMGIGFEAQVLYTFPMKKRQAKKMVE